MRPTAIDGTELGVLRETRDGRSYYQLRAWAQSVASDEPGEYAEVKK
jgi:hypothetical protein